MNQAIPRNSPVCPGGWTRCDETISQVVCKETILDKILHTEPVDARLVLFFYLHVWPSYWLYTEYIFSINPQRLCSVYPNGVRSGIATCFSGAEFPGALLAGHAAAHRPDPRHLHRRPARRSVRLHPLQDPQRRPHADHRPATARQVGRVIV